MNIIISNQVDEGNRESLIAEVAKIRASLDKYNIHEIPSPQHINRWDYGTKEEYKSAKELYFKTYKGEVTTLKDEMKRCENLITELARAKVEEDYKKQLATGTVELTPEEKEHIRLTAELAGLKAQGRKAHNASYYEQTKETAKKKREIKAAIKTNGVKKDAAAVGASHLVKTKEVIKPLCLCGKRCGVIKVADMKTHSKLKKHQLFKSVIKLIHYKRQFKNIKKSTTDINKHLADSKRVVRKKMDDGSSFTITKRTEKDLIEYYTDQALPMNEDLVPPLRYPYIEPVEYTEKYKHLILGLRVTTYYMANK